MAIIDYKQKIKDYMNSSEVDTLYKSMLNNLFPELKERNSKKSDVIKCLINGMKFYYEDNKEATWGTDKWSMPVKDIIEVLEKQTAQTFAWSEEDEERLSDAIFFVREYQIPTRDKVFLNAAKEAEDWLKSLKDKVQNITYYNPYKEVVESIAEMCKHYDKASHNGLRDFYDNVKVKCKDAKEYDSLYPQNTWKPSDEMLEALYRVIPQFTMNKSEDEVLLDKLYQGLKYGKVLNEK